MRDFIRPAIAVAAIAVLASFGAISFPASTLAQAPAKQAAPTPPPAPEPLKQIALTDKQIESLIAAQKEMDAVTDKLPEGAQDKPDPKLQAQLEGIAKKNGFADFNEYGNVYDNVSMVMTGIDPKTKAFTQPPEMLKKQIAAVTADPKIPAKDKKAILDEMNAAIKTTTNVQFPDNIALVTKYYDKLGPLLQDDQ
ncbi:MAG: hypothetical protein HY242_03190 [Afipia sp.]|nr:hypothetical protein [Afipia sp.]